MSANEGTLNHNMEDNLVGITVKYIYVIRNIINDKVYVGQAVDPHKRFAGHLSEVRQNRDNSAIHGAMNKYGVENFYMEVLEGPISNYNEREKFWISFFNSVSPNGYNILAGGEDPPIRRAFQNNKSKFTPEQVEEIYELIKNPTLTLSEIASFEGCSYRTISNINKGVTYYSDKNKYPIRDFQSSGESANMLSLETVERITKMLIESEDSFLSIAKTIGCRQNQVSEINDGVVKRYRLNNIEYPIRKSNGRVTKEIANKIKKELKIGLLNKNQIANKYNVSYADVSNINSGRNWFDENESYPLKKHEGRLNFDENVYEGIRKALADGKSDKTIMKEFNTPNITLIHDINSGKTHKNSNYSYPIRKKSDRFTIEEVRAIENEIANTKRTLSDIAKEFGCHKSTVVQIKNGSWKKYLDPNKKYPLR